MTKHTDFVVVGGGIVGLMTAARLAAEGGDTVLLEAGDLGAQASGPNAGSLHLQIQYPEFVSYGEAWARIYQPCLGFLKDSLRLWQDLPQRLGGEDLGVKLAGGLIAATTDAQMAHIRSKAKIEADAGVETEILGAEDMRKIAPYLADNTIGGGFCAMEGKANPLRATPILARSATDAGAQLVCGVCVEDIEQAGDGFVVRTTRGSVHTRKIVNAAGASAGRIGAMIGTSLEIRGFPLQVTVTEPVAPLIPHLVYSAAGKLSLKQVENGGCVIGGGWSARERPDSTLVINPANLVGNMETAVGVVPAMRQARAIRSWTAWVNGTGDWRPILGEDPNVPGVIHALFPWVGFSAAPMTAQIAADLALGRPPALPLKGISLLYD